MEITKGQVDQLYATYKVNVYGMSFYDFTHGDPALVHDLVAMKRGKPVGTNEKLTGKEVAEAFAYFFVEGATGSGAEQSLTIGAPEPAKV